MRHFLRIVTVLALALAAQVAPAHAAPPDYLGLDQLRSLLAAAPDGIEGYFLTVPGGPSVAQQSPVKVRMTVKAVADGQGPDGALILFEADMTDPVMQDIGGIAAGMSGSPLFIDAGGYKMIGALSYGDIFTLNGLGLATPIEYMLDTQAEWPPVALRAGHLPDTSGPFIVGHACTVEELDDHRDVRDRQVFDPIQLWYQRQFC